MILLFFKGAASAAGHISRFGFWAGGFGNVTGGDTPAPHTLYHFRQRRVRM